MVDVFTMPIALTPWFQPVLHKEGEAIGQLRNILTYAAAAKGNIARTLLTVCANCSA
jgi:hypothetical protein